MRKDERKTTFGDVAKAFEILKKNGYAVEEILRMEIDTCVRDEVMRGVV